MRIFKGYIVGALCLALAACDGGFDLREFGIGKPAALQKMVLPDGTVVGGAEGWCIDEATSRTGPGTSVVVFGSCAAISGDASQPHPDVPGMVTVSVETEAGALPDTEMLEMFFASDAGRAALARDGMAESVDILHSRREEDLLYLHAADNSVSSGASNEVWRALFGLGGRFVAVSFYTRIEDSIELEDGIATLAAQVEELRAANQG